MIPLKDENPTRSFPIVTITLIATNVAVYLYQLTLSPQELYYFIAGYGMIPAELLGFAPRVHTALPGALTLVTSQFVHGSLFHLVGNMLYLWIFGNNIEDVLGKIRFILFYLFCGVIAAIAHLALNPYSTLPMVGASGAIAGVLGAYLITFPGTRILTLVILIFFVTTVRVPAFYVLGLWFVMQLFYVLGDSGGQSTHVAYMAHIGGFLVGILLMRRMRSGRRWKQRW
jgi:membrane associated rhomboid family serine protease